MPVSDGVIKDDTGPLHQAAHVVVPDDEDGPIVVEPRVCQHLTVVRGVRDQTRHFAVHVHREVAQAEQQLHGVPAVV